MQEASGEFRKRQEWKGFSGLFIGLAAVVLLAVSIVVLGNANENAFRWVDHTRDVLNVSQQLLSTAENVDTSARGFVATRDSRFLQPYTTQLPQLKNLAQELQRQTIDNAKQQETITQRLVPALNHVQSHSQSLMEEKSTSANDLIAQKQVMDELRTAVGDIQKEEDRLLKERTTEFLHLAKIIWIIRFTLLGTALCSIMLGVLGLRNLIKHEREQISALEIANKRLEEETMERRRAEQAANEANEAKSTFVASISHEIRTPLSGVIGMSELLLYAEELSDDSRDLASRLHRASKQMLAVLNEILDYSKLEAGQMQVEVGEFDPRSVLDDVIGLSSFKAHEKGIALEGVTDDAVPHKITGDENKVRQVLLNFVHNAIKFTLEGSVKVSIQSDGDGHVKFSVRDTGIGLSQTSQERIFKPYAQADKSTMRKFGGTGLGLSISKKYVELMHGAIGLDSQSGKGTDVWFTIPNDLSNS
jgi:signal transduction histidine kinase